MTLYFYRGCVIKGDSHKMETNNNLYIYVKDKEIAHIRCVEIETCYRNCEGKEVEYFTVRDLK